HAVPGIIPNGFHKITAAAHKTGATTAVNLPSFQIAGILPKISLLFFLVYFGTAVLFPAFHNIKHRLLATHDFADNRVNQPFFDQRFHSARCFHSLQSPVSWVTNLSNQKRATSQLRNQYRENLAVLLRCHCASGSDDSCVLTVTLSGSACFSTLCEDRFLRASESR